MYDRVRFIGYVIPTTPAEVVPIGDPDGTGSMAGTYRALADIDADIAARAAQLEQAVTVALDAVPDGESGVLTVFVVPEFYWHGTLGPYTHAPGETDPVDRVIAALRGTLPLGSRPDVLFVCGSVITSAIADVEALFDDPNTRARNDIVRSIGEAWRISTGAMNGILLDMLGEFLRAAHAYPSVEVRNRGIVLGAGVGETTVEKYFDSNEDFLLWDTAGAHVITEQMTAYPVIDTTAGDVKRHPADPHAIFSVAGEAVAVEVCLDHADERIRQSLPREDWPLSGDGLALHIIPSCGMQLKPASVAARAGGWAFNCDGEYALGDATHAGKAQHGEVGGVGCVWVDHVAPGGSDQVGHTQGGHTQLAHVVTAPVGGYSTASGAHDAVFGSVEDIAPVVRDVPPTAQTASVFAGGPGQVHIYGPVPLTATGDS